ncbi:tetratricopeptide repeat protein [Parahaliea mediterranea]|uniref:Ancillary SecYEG translocon subunit n=1 Tax=Parahaliea mediterranea TaxID=651086 RepID=A0A939DEP1_9GAMM|nr:tetratricopeptide repeat protein [Parahaliea mediterranea]
METYRSEEEQVEALKRWWDENGRSTVIGIALALVGVFGWQGWQEYSQGQRDAASDIYQQLLQAAGGAAQSPAQQGVAERLAQRLKDEYAGSTYAQFAGLQLARLAVADGDLEQAESELRAVLADASSGGDVALVARQRLARVVAARGETDAALALLDVSGSHPYQASYALARGDILFGEGRRADALGAYQLARQLESESPGQLNLASLERKLARLSPVSPEAPEPAPTAAEVEQ